MTTATAAPASSTTVRYLEEAERFSAHNYHPLPVVLDRGEGSWVWDVDGNRYLDMLSSYSALNQGHRHPAILQAAHEQLDRLTLTSRAFHNDQMGPFLRELCEASGFDAALPMNTGAEAVETAIKMVRKWGYQVRGVPDGQAEIIVCEDNFHGRTTTIVGFSSEAQYREGFGPFTPGFKLVPYGDVDALRQAIGPNTVGFMVEPIQGEAGVVVPPDGYLRETAALCRDLGVAFVADEIQTGLGRTGRLFCCDWEGVCPDVLVVGKALGGGVYPVSAVIADAEFMGAGAASQSRCWQEQTQPEQRLPMTDRHRHQQRQDVSDTDKQRERNEKQRIKNVKNEGRSQPPYQARAIQRHPPHRPAPCPPRSKDLPVPACPVPSLPVAAQRLRPRAPPAAI